MEEINHLNNHTIAVISGLLFSAFFTSYYLIKNIQKIKNELKTILVLLIFGAFFLSYYNYQENISFNALRSNYSLSKGKINNYFISNKFSLRGGTGSNDLKYTYNVSNREFENKYSDRGYIDIPDVKPDLTIEYLVLFEKDNPQNSVILLNYPIKSKNDFKKYEIIFASGIPKNVFKR